MKLVEHVELTEQNGLPRLNWVWTSPEQVVIDIYARRWSEGEWNPDEASGEPPGIHLESVKKKEGLAVSGVTLRPRDLEPGIYHLILVPRVSESPGEASVMANVALGRRRCLRYRIEGRPDGTALLYLKGDGGSFPASHFRIRCAGGRILPFLTDLPGNGTFVLGDMTTSFQVEPAPPYRDCYEVRADG